jgi:hypothetical protein
VSLSASNGLNAYIQNTGSTTITITGVYILNATTNSLICGNTTSTGGLPATPISPGQTAQITATFSGCTINPNTTYLVKFVTAEGTQYTVSVVASS